MNALNRHGGILASAIARSVILNLKARPCDDLAPPLWKSAASYPANRFAIMLLLLGIQGRKISCMHTSPFLPTCFSKASHPE